jgi:hypothetical protein
MKKALKARKLLLVGSVLLVLVGGYDTPVLAEPPPWAPAHGYRAKHRYHYYPSAQVYFDTGRNLYFHYSGGEWRVSAQLPGGISLQGRAYTIVDTESERPYLRQPPVADNSPSGVHKQHHKKKGKHK